MRNKVENLFHDLRDLSTEARARYCSEVGITEQTRREVEALLAFDSCLTNSLDADLTHVASAALDCLDSQPAICGSYRLREIVGRGGMGTVYLAERIDGEVAHYVAIKLLRSGGDDPHARARFRAERQILAGLSHPNIARLLDVGHREDGQPFLVMEHVQGLPIDEYAEGLGIRQIIRLILKVCGAVAYLHRNLIVHRDLKPANILVSPDGEPKLLDFGIAKILDAANDFTQTSMRLLTPEYASPEQVSGDPITTASDIYSLGSVLYKLLTGSSPHQFDAASSSGISDGIINAPIKAPSNLLPALPRDVESVLTKALRRDPHDRYATVEQFADDLENFLQFRPVRARKGDRRYRMRKFLRRHWLPAAAVALALDGLSSGMLVANHQRAIAQRRFVEVRQL